jgi:hypothetical protein
MTRLLYPTHDHSLEPGIDMDSIIQPERNECIYENTATQFPELLRMRGRESCWAAPFFETCLEVAAECQFLKILGYPGIVCTGSDCAMLDEAAGRSQMGGATIRLSMFTARLQIRYRKSWCRFRAAA